MGRAGSCERRKRAEANHHEELPRLCSWLLRADNCAAWNTLGHRRTSWTSLFVALMFMSARLWNKMLNLWNTENERTISCPFIYIYNMRMYCISGLLLPKYLYIHIYMSMTSSSTASEIVLASVMNTHGCRMINGMFQQSKRRRNWNPKQESRNQKVIQGNISQHSQ